MCVHFHSGNVIGGVWISLAHKDREELYIITEVIFSDGKFFKQNKPTPGVPGGLIENKWYHIVLSISPSMGGFVTYVDGKVYHDDKNEKQRSPSNLLSEPFLVCKATPDTEIHCDDFMVWDREFDANEVEEFYQDYDVK